MVLVLEAETLLSLMLLDDQCVFDACQNYLECLLVVT